MRFSRNLIHLLIVTRAWVLRDQMAKEALRSLGSGSSGVESNISPPEDLVLFGSGLVSPFIFMRIVHSYVWSSEVSGTYVFTF